MEAERLIGVARVLLEGLLLQVENELDARILSMEGRQCGTLRVEVWPLANDGTPGIPDEEVVEDAQELLGTRMAILVRIPHASGLPEDLAHDVRVEYDYFIDEKPQQVPRVLGPGCNPAFNYDCTFVQDPVTSRFLEYLRTKMLVFRIYGRDVAAENMQAEALAAAQAEASALAAQAAASAAAESLEVPLAAEPLEKMDTHPQAGLADAGTGDGMAQPGTPPDPEQQPGEPSPTASSGAPKAPSLSKLRTDAEKAAEVAEQSPATGKKSKACSIL